MLRIAAALAVVSTLAPLTGQAPTHDLRTTARPGKAVWFLETTEQSQLVGGASGQRVGLRFERTFSVTIRKVEANGDLVASIDVRRVRGSIDLPVVGARTFDSDDERTGKDPTATAGLGAPVCRMLESVEHAFLARIDVHGDVRAAVVRLAPVGEQDDATRESQQHALTRLCEAVFGELPPEPVALGAEWDYRRSSPKGSLPLLQAGRMKLRSIDDDVVVLGLTGALTLPPKLANDPAIGFEIRDGKLSGEQTISRATGLVESAKLRAIGSLVTRTRLGEDETKLTVTTSLRRIDAPKRQQENGEARKVR